MATQTWTVKTVVSCIRLTVRISSARHGVDVSPPLRLLVPNPDTVRFSYIMERGTGSGLLLKMFCGTPVALRFCFLMQKHVHSWWYRHQLKIGRCSRVCPVMEGSFRGIAQNGLRDPTFFLFLGPQVFFFMSPGPHDDHAELCLLDGQFWCWQGWGGMVPSCSIPNSHPAES